MTLLKATAKLSTSFIILFMVVGFFSCKTERIAYFKDVPDSTSQVKNVPLPAFTSPVVNADDILNITVQTIDPAANQVLNQGNLPVLSGNAAGNSLGGSQLIVAGYLVTKEGKVHMPYVGDIMVKGLTTDQVRDLIQSKIAVFFKEPVVNVRFANFKVTILGEVKNPSTFIIPNEKPTVIDALGLAGDITIYGRRDIVMLIRDINGQKEITRLDMDNTASISSPYFYLRPNDVIYVEPTASRVESTNSYRVRDIALISSALSLLVILTSRVLFR